LLPAPSGSCLPENGPQPASVSAVSGRRRRRTPGRCTRPVPAGMFARWHCRRWNPGSVSRRPWSDSSENVLYKTMRVFRREGLTQTKSSAGSAVIRAREGIVEPGPGHGPVALGGGRGNAQGGGGLLQRQSGEVAELHQLGLGWLLPGQFSKGLV